MAEIDYTDEIWKPIPYALNYAVSDHGRVKRISRGRGARPNHILATSNWSPKRDYVCAHIVTNEGKVVTRRMNRLVLEVFVGPASPRHLAAHGDGNSLNNRLGNLRWATQKENMADAAKHGTLARGDAYKDAKLTEAIVHEIRASGLLQREIAEQFGITQSAVSRVIARKIWAHV